jgi:hypothetical protein
VGKSRDDVEKVMVVLTEANILHNEWLSAFLQSGAFTPLY